MMTKPKSSRKQWLRFAYLIPIVSVSLATSAKIQKEEVLNFGPSVVLDDQMEQLTDENRLITLVDDLDDLKKIASERGLTRKVKSNLDFNDHFTRKSMDGKSIIVHLPKGFVYVNDKGSKTIEADVNYAFPKGGFDWQLNGVPFDENNIPVIHYDLLKKVENHWNGKKNVVNLVTNRNPIIALHVTSEDNKPIVGAVAMVEGVMIGSDSDINGDITLEANTGSTVVVADIGYESKRLIVSDKKPHNYQVTLKKAGQY